MHGDFFNLVSLSNFFLKIEKKKKIRKLAN